MKDNETHSVGTELPGLHHLRCPICLHAHGCHIPKRNRCACSSAMAICTASFPVPPTAPDIDSTSAKTTIAEPHKQVTEPETCGSHAGSDTLGCLGATGPCIKPRVHRDSCADSEGRLWLRCVRCPGCRELVPLGERAMHAFSCSRLRVARDETKNAVPVSVPRTDLPPSCARCGEQETCMTCGHTRACHDAKPNDPLCCPAGMSCWHFGPPPPPVPRAEGPTSCARCGVGFVSWDAIETDEYEGQLRKVHAECPTGAARLCLSCSAPFTEGHVCQKLAAARERFQEKLAASKEAPLYASLRRVLDLACAQAAVGKGAQRHGSPGVPFEEQPTMRICEWLESNHFALGQAIKKLRESARLPKEQALADILGAIVYGCHAYSVRERLP